MKPESDLLAPNTFEPALDGEISGSDEIYFDDWSDRGVARVGHDAEESRIPIVARRTPAPVEIEGWPPKPGTILLGKYEVDRVLGRGGMGVVVVAHHIQLRQRVAIKFLHPAAMKNVDVVARFAREARVLASIQSEHVVRFLDVGTLERGEPYMIMECLEGTDLSRLVRRRGPLPVEEAVEYILQACEPLGEAHAAGIVHRDLKPSNLYLARRADAHIIKVIDFGISKMISSAGESDDTSITTTSVILGSPLYMSPEQLRSSKDIDARSDIWALGVILFKLLTGKTPFVPDTLAQLCAMILLQAPPRVTDLRPSLPAGLAEVIQKCMEKDPADRYQNVAELAQALARFTIAPSSSASVLRTLRLSRTMSMHRLTPLPGEASRAILAKAKVAEEGASPPRKPRLPPPFAGIVARFAGAVTLPDSWYDGRILPVYRRKRWLLGAIGASVFVTLALALTWVSRTPPEVAVSKSTTLTTTPAAAVTSGIASWGSAATAVLSASASPPKLVLADVPPPPPPSPARVATPNPADAPARVVTKPATRAPAPRTSPRIDNSQFGDRK